MEALLTLGVSVVSGLSQATQGPCPATPVS